MNDVSVGALITKLAVALDSECVAFTTSLQSPPTATVFTENVALIAPLGMVMDAGTDAREFDVDNDTSVPPVAAFELSVTVPDSDVPPTTEAGVTTTFEMLWQRVVAVRQEAIKASKTKRSE